jgi:outer membrane protein assembly factor BamB
MKYGSIVCTVALICCGLACAANAQEWPRFRGPNGSGIGAAPSVPVQFTEKEYNWKVTLPGGGHSSPVVWRDHLFVTCSEKETATRIVLCLSAADGGTVWRHEIKAHPYPEHADNDYASSTPATDGKSVYVAWSTPEEYALSALDAADGHEVWKVGLGRYVSQHGSGTSPIVVGDVVLLGNDQEGQRGSIVGVDRNTGHKLWEIDRKAGKSGGMSAATPVVLKGSDGSEQAVFCSRYEGITALDPRTGSIAWQIPDAFHFRTVGSPVVLGDNLIAGFSGEGPRGHEFIVARPEGTKASVAYQLKEAIPYVPTPLYKDGMLFILSDTGTMSCYRADSGKLLWQNKIGPAYYSSPVCTGEKIFCISKKGEVAAIAASEKFDVLGHSQLGELCHATPAISGGIMYVRTYSHVISIGGGK